jgi:inner membrane protein
MENLTHTLVGLMMARCGLEKTTVRGAGMMMLAANAPDVDAVFWFNRLHYLDYHRGYLHSFACAPAVALLPMLLVRAKFSWQSYAAALAGVLSHLLLDYTNPYGIQLLLPFSHRRLMLDITNIADVWIWAILFVGLLVPLFLRALRHGADSLGSPRATWAWIALTTLVTYEGARFAMHAKAVEMVASHMYNGAAPLEAIAVPADFTHPLRWRGIARGSGFATIVPMDVQEAYDPSLEVTYVESPSAGAVAAARELPEFQTIIRFSQAPFWKTTPVSGGTLVELLDLRYGTPDKPGFAFVSSVISTAAARTVR